MPVSHDHTPLRRVSSEGPSGRKCCSSTQPTTINIANCMVDLPQGSKDRRPGFCWSPRTDCRFAGKAAFIGSWTPDRRKSSVQNVLVKTGSRSLTMEHGMPWSLTMLSKKTLARETAVYGWPNGRKWLYLEKQLTTVRTTDFPPMRGKPSTKSTAMLVHTKLGSSRGCNNPAGWRCSDLLH
jgi:hypothetical protein